MKRRSEVESDVDPRLFWIVRHWDDLDERAHRNLYDLAVCHYDFIRADKAARERRRAFEIV